MGDFMQRFLEDATVTGLTVTAEGYLVADAFTARTGIQNYAGYEVGRPDLQVVKVYRPAEEVFHSDALRSFSHVPVTDDHPSTMVDASNWKSLAKGETGEEVLRDGQRLRIPLIVKDADTVAKVQAGKRQLSVGYLCALDWSAGTTEDGQAYDAVQRDIRANHIAVVATGRAGPEFRIGDSAAHWGAAPIINHDKGLPMTLRQIVLDGITIETTQNGVEAINRLKSQLSDAEAKMGTADAAHLSALAAKDSEIGELKIKLADAEKKIPTADGLRKMIADRLELVAAAGKLSPSLDVATLADADIRREIVKAKYGEEILKDSSEAEINGMFRVLAADAAKQNLDPVRGALQQGVKDSRSNAAPADNGQAEYQSRLTDAWKTA